jgi:penicillin-binding protein-related factor A (putative recombinase)
MQDTGTWLEAKFRDMLPDNCYQIKPTDFKSLSFIIANFPQIASRIPKVPCDRIVIYKGKSYFFELKHQTGPSIAYSRLASHQIGSLLNHEAKGGGKSYVVIGFKIGSKCRLFALRIGYWLDLLRTTGKKSLNIAEITPELELNRANILKIIE